MNEIVKFIEIHYPNLKSRIEIVGNANGTTLKIPFKNPRYTLWVDECNDESYIVGINELHSHYDLESKNENRENAIAEVREIIDGKILVIRKKGVSKNYTINTLDYNVGIEKYSNASDNIELITFSGAV